MKKKIKKLFKNPKGFWVDFFYKRASGLPRASPSKFRANFNLNIFISGNIEDLEGFFKRNSAQLSNIFKYYYSDGVSYWQLQTQATHIGLQELDTNPMRALEDGYCFFCHTDDALSRGFLDDFLSSLNSGNFDLCVPEYQQSLGVNSAPKKRTNKIELDCYESIQGLLVHYSLIQKVLNFNQVSWAAFEGSALLLGILSLVDRRRIHQNSKSKYIYIKKTWGSGFRINRREELSEVAFNYFNNIIYYTKNLKSGNENLFFVALIYALVDFLKFGFLKKKSTWQNKKSFSELFATLVVNIPVRYFQAYKKVLPDRLIALFNKHYNLASLALDIRLLNYDKKRSEYLFSHHHHLEASARSSLQTMSGGLLSEQKLVRHVYFDDLCVYELRAWIVWMPSHPLSIKFDGYKVKINNNSYAAISPVHLENFMRRSNQNFMVDQKLAGCWLLMDRDNQADDNAEHLYRHIMSLKNFKPKIFFALKEDSHDWARLHQDGFNLVAYGSKKYEAVLNSADKIISSHAAAFVFDYFKDKSLFKKDLIFLQHGITYNDLSPLFEPEWKDISLFISASGAEYQGFVQDGSPYKFSQKNVALTGFPRHDFLLQKSDKFSREHPDQKAIVIMPTWRPYLLGKILQGTERALIDNFEETSFFQHWNGLLNSDVLAKISNQGIGVKFFPHPNVIPYLSKFNLPNFVQVLTFEDVSIQNLFAESSLMITDYSSVSFEMGLLKKPIIYYQFDQEEFYSRGLYNAGYFDTARDGFGPVVFEEKDLSIELENMVSRNFKSYDLYLQRMKDFYAFDDQHSCARVVAAIQKLDEPIDLQAYEDAMVEAFVVSNHYQDCRDFISNFGIERHAALLLFLDWRLTGYLPQDWQSSPYRDLIEFDLNILSFNFNPENLSVEKNENAIFTTLRKEQQEMLLKLQSHTNNGILLENIFPKDFYYFNLLDLYLSGSWEELIADLSLQYDIKSFQALGLTEWAVIWSYAKSTKYRDFYSLAEDLLPEQQQSRLLMILSTLSRDTLPAQAMLRTAFDQSCLEFTSLVRQAQRIVM